MIESYYIVAGLIFLISILLNVALIWHNRSLVGKLYDVSENLSDLLEEVALFYNHLNSVHELEVFYGDETLGSLIRHSSGLLEVLEDFEDIYALFDEEGEKVLEEVPDDASIDTKTAP